MILVTNLGLDVTALEWRIRRMSQSEAGKSDRLLESAFTWDGGEGSRLFTGEEAALMQAVEAKVKP